MGQLHALLRDDNAIDWAMASLAVKPASRQRIVTPYLPPWKQKLLENGGCNPDASDTYEASESSASESSDADADGDTSNSPQAALSPRPQLVPLKLRKSAAPPRPSPTGRLELPPSPTQPTSRIVPIGGRRAAERRAALANKKAEVDSGGAVAEE